MHHAVQSFLVGALAPHDLGSQRDLVSFAGPSNNHAGDWRATDGPIWGRNEGHS